MGICQEWAYSCKYKLLYVKKKTLLLLRKEKTFNNRNLYKQEGGQFVLYFAFGQWNIGREEPANPKTSGRIGVRQKVFYQRYILN